MKYYKLISGQNFIGIADSNSFLEQNPISNWLLIANEITGQYVQCNNLLYRDYWMPAINENSQIAFLQADVIEITEEEYLIYKAAIENNEEVIVPDTHYADDEIIIPEEPEEPSVTFVRSSKINEMSRICRQTIEAGFDINIRGATRHFSLTTQDQLNLMGLESLAKTTTEIPYHADGEEVIFYTQDEINAIIAAANSFKIYQTTYHNALKEYINSLETIEEISAIQYGIDIPEKFKTEVLKVLEYR